MNRMGGIVRQVVHRPTPSRAMAFDLLREMCPCPRAQGELDRLEAETGAAIVVRISGVSRVTAASSIAIELRQLVAELVWTRNSLDISCPGGSGPTIMHLLGPGAPPLSIRNARTGPNGKACLVTVTPSQITFQRFRDRTLDGPSGDSPAFVSYSQKETSVAYFDRGTPVRNPLRTNEATMAMR
jgi:hypothetical protein